MPFLVNARDLTVSGCCAAPKHAPVTLACAARRAGPTRPGDPRQDFSREIDRRLLAAAVDADATHLQATRTSVDFGGKQESVDHHDCLHADESGSRQPGSVGLSRWADAASDHASAWRATGRSPRPWQPFGKKSRIGTAAAANFHRWPDGHLHRARARATVRRRLTTIVRCLSRCELLHPSASHRIC